MKRSELFVGMLVCFVIAIVAVCLWAHDASAQVPVQAGPQKFPAPADLGQVRMHFVAGHLTIYAPSSKVTTRPGMDAVTTVIEVDTTPSISVPLTKK